MRPVAAAIPASPAVIPQLSFTVQRAQSLEPAAVPTLRFALRIDAEPQPIRSIVLDVQIQIAARRRAYSRAAEGRLGDLFGTPERWGTTLRTLPWLRTTTVVPAFEDTTEVDLLVPCTYDLEVTATAYFAALEDGLVPLEFLFSGSVFYAAPGGALQTARIGWDREADYALPVSVWRGMMDRHFAHSAWLRVGQESFDALCEFKARGQYTSWDEAIAALMERHGQ